MLSPLAAVALELVEGVELDMPELELPVEPEVAPDDLVLELLDGVLVVGLQHGEALVRRIQGRPLRHGP